MTLSRRELLAGLAAASAAAGGGAVAVGRNMSASPAWVAALLPDKASFSVAGTYLNAAYTHPLSRPAHEAGSAYQRMRWGDSAHSWPSQNPRDEAVTRFARLINAKFAEIAVVPSTEAGENLIVASLTGAARKKIVTDSLHFYGSLAQYGELRRQGAPITVIPAPGGVLDPDAFEEAIDKDTGLVAISLVSSVTGFQHDLKRLCELAHSRGALVYADIIQAAGAVPIDVRASGVDFCCCGAYKWLMGDAGVAFLYVRGDRLPELRRVQVGWREMATEGSHILPFEPPGPSEGTWTFRDDTAGKFEVSSPSYWSLATAAGALSYLEAVGVARIAEHRKSLLSRLGEVLPKRGFLPLTPADSEAPFAVFAFEGAAARFASPLDGAGVHVSLYEHRIRIAPSVYNDVEDIERLLAALS